MVRRMKKSYKGQFNPTPKGLTLLEIVDYFPTDDKARAHLESLTWPNGPTCPRCGISDPLRIAKVTANKAKKVRAGLYCCKDCRRQFTVTTNTIFEATHIPLRKWLIAWYLLCSSKKGISSLQLQRMLSLGSYRTALFMTHRIRHALTQPEFTEQLQGEVEVDECYVGGKPRHANNGDGDTKYYPKTPVVSLVERNGNKRSLVMMVNGESIRQAVSAHVSRDAHIMTDESAVYTPIMHVPGSQHHSVNHSAKEYHRKEGERDVHTNSVESSFALLKRGVVGTFHHISFQHTPKYMAEFDFRWNTRHDSDTERTEEGIKMTRGKRLTYTPMVQNAAKPLKVLKTRKKRMSKKRLASESKPCE